MDRIGADLFTPYGKIGVCLFVLITGYFLGDKFITVISVINRGWKVWSETFFYAIFMWIVFAFFSKKLSLLLLVKSILPVTTNLYWFVTGYIILILLLPAINLLLNNINKKQFQYLIVVIMILNFMIPVLQKNLEIMIISPYLLGAYVKINGFEINHKGFYLTFIMVISYLQVVVLNVKGHGLALTIGIIPTLTALLIFLIVLESKPFYNVTINKLATTTFAGYIITEYPLMRDLLWQKILNLSNIKSALFADLIGFSAIFIILYIGVFLVDLVRQKIFNILKIDNIPEHIVAFIKNNSYIKRYLK